jgi:hypothetical protein
MVSALAKKVLDDAEQSPKIQVLYKHTGKKAFDIAKSMLKADETWAEQFTSSQNLTHLPLYIAAC